MLPLSLNLADFHPGRLPPLLARPRLTDQLQRQPAKGIILIQGQAAQGKTALVADFLSHGPSKVAWLTLEQGQGEAGGFIKRVADILTRASAACPLDRQARPDRRNRFSWEKPESWRRKLPRTVSALPEGMEIVLDGLEHLADDPTVHTLLCELCRLATTRCRLWLLSRRMAAFKPIQDCFGRRMLLLNNADLAFTPREIGQFFSILLDRPQPPERIHHLHKLTDGWGGGLVLAAQAPEEQPREWDMPHEAALDLSRFTEEVFRYFYDEIYGCLPAHQRKLLLTLGLTDVIDPDFYAGHPQMQPLRLLLDDFVANLGFIQAFVAPSGRRSLYRFNRLFHDFLHSRLAFDLTLEEQRERHNLLGRLYDGQGDLVAAVRHWIKGGRYQAAGDGLRKIGVDLVIKGQLVALEDWLKQMPEERIQSEPWLFLLLTLARRVKGQARSVEEFHRIWEQFCQGRDIRGRMITAAFLMEALVFQGRPVDECLAWIQRGKRLLSLQGKIPYYAWAKLLLWQQIAFSHIACGLDLARGISAARNALLLARKMGNGALTRQSAIIYGLGLIANGENQKAQGLLDESVAVPAESPLQMYEVLALLGRAQIDLRRGDDSAAEAKIQSAGTCIEGNGLVFLYPYYVEATGYLQLARKKYDKALQTGRHLVDVSILAGNPFCKTLAHHLCGLIHYNAKKYSRAAAEADLALELLSRRGPETHYVMRVHQLKAITCLHLGRHGQALELLNRTLTYFKKDPSALALAETYFMLGLVHDKRRALKRSRETFQQGLSLSAQGGFSPFVILNPDDRKKIISLAQDTATDPPRQTSPARAAPNAKPGGATTQITMANAFAVVDWRNAEPGWLDIRTLGQFAVLRDGKTPFTDRQWGGSKPKLFFKALLVHGLREIPKDMIVDHLWPESSPRAANQNFKVTLHRLRKILEPEFSQDKNSSLIQLKDNLLSLDKRRCRVDVEEFLICCKELKRHDANEEVDRIAILGHRIMELYQGDFLPEEPYAPWIEMKRWALRDSYMQSILQISRHYFEQGLFQAAGDCCRAAIQIDPLQESIIRQLLLVYRRCGRRRDAVDVFEQYRSALKMELNVEPDAETLILMEGIRGDMTLV